MQIYTMNYLNSIYEPLYKKTKKLTKYLANHGFSSSWQFCNLHSVRMEETFATEYFPIPVITVERLCDIGLDIERYFIEGKLKRMDALRFDFAQLEDLDFEIYGINDYEVDFYHEGMDLTGIKSRIMASHESEIGICVYLPLDCPMDQLTNTVTKFQSWGTYIRC